VAYREISVTVYKLKIWGITPIWLNRYVLVDHGITFSGKVKSDPPGYYGPEVPCDWMEDPFPVAFDTLGVHALEAYKIEDPPTCAVSEDILVTVCDEIETIGELVACGDTQPKTGWNPWEDVNGCGASGHPLTTWIQTILNALDFDFRDACDAHDVQYGTCNTNKGVADLALETAMQTWCGEQEGFSEGELTLCIATATLGWDILQLEAATEAYEEGQRKACMCCDPPP